MAISRWPYSMPTTMRCFLPLHIYEGQTGKLITAILRPGARPTGNQIVSLLKRLIAHLRQAWPQVEIFFTRRWPFFLP